ncbi:MAG: hypothetical protein U0X74_08660 [Anaerolineales bacterium]
MRDKSESPLVLYSASSWLAFAIAERYYGGYHYIWCTPHFDPSSVPSISYAVPPSSSPVEIYRNLREDVKRGDRHSAKIAANKAGILRGVEHKLTAGEITTEQGSEIASIVDAAEPQDFRPFIFVVPFALVEKIIKPVPVSQRAHPLSIEFIIDKLPRDKFDVIDFDGR